jgi:hypothetical protein
MHRARRSGRRLRRDFLTGFHRRLRTNGLDPSGRLRARGLRGRGVRRFGLLRLLGFTLPVRRAVSIGQAAPQLERDIVIERTRMRFLVRHAEFGQQIQDDVGLDLQLAGQLVDADFTHTVAPSRSFSASLVAICLSSIRKPLMLPDAPCFLS